MHACLFGSGDLVDGFWTAVRYELGIRGVVDDYGAVGCGEIDEFLQLKS